MEEPQEVTDRRWRGNLIAAIESIAETKELLDLHNPELTAQFWDCVSDDHEAHGAGAMTEEERAQTEQLARSLEQTCKQAFVAKRERIGGKVVHGLEPEDLITFGWFESVQPLAKRAFQTFMKRGWMTEGVW